MISCPVNTTATAGLEALDVELVVLVEELQQVQEARLQAELSRCTYSLHGLEPLMRPCRRRVPAVDGGVVLQARVGALPGRVGDLAEQVAGGHASG